mgnify:CR=1 FL=1
MSLICPSCLSESTALPRCPACHASLPNTQEPGDWRPPGWTARARLRSDAGGVWLAQHPETALLDHPDVADVYERCRLHPELTPTDRDTLSAWQYTLAADFCAAFNRRQLAEVKDR